MLGYSIGFPSDLSPTGFSNPMDLLDIDGTGLSSLTYDGSSGQGGTGGNDGGDDGDNADFMNFAEAL